MDGRTGGDNMTGQAITLVILLTVTLVSLLLLCILDPAHLAQAAREQKR